MSDTDRDVPACPTGKITHLTRAQAAKAVRETPRDFRRGFQDTHDIRASEMGGQVS
jgi:hypothetical protein